MTQRFSSLQRESAESGPPIRTGGEVAPASSRTEIELASVAVAVQATKRRRMRLVLHLENHQRFTLLVSICQIDMKLMQPDHSDGGNDGKHPEHSALPVQDGIH